MDGGKGLLVEELQNAVGVVGLVEGSKDDLDASNLAENKEEGGERRGVGKVALGAHKVEEKVDGEEGASIEKGERRDFGGGEG